MADIVSAFFVAWGSFFAVWRLETYSRTLNDCHSRMLLAGIPANSGRIADKTFGENLTKRFLIFVAPAGWFTRIATWTVSVREKSLTESTLSLSEGFEMTNRY